MIEQILRYKRTFSKRIGKDTWRFELLRPGDRTRRASLKSSLLGDVPLANVSVDDENTAIILATLQISYRDGPDWFKKDCNEKFGDIPDDEYLIMLVDEYFKREKEFEEFKKKCRLDGGSQEGKVDHNSTPISEI